MEIKKRNKKGIVFWITGFPGSGKTAIAKTIRKKIEKKYGPTVLFSGDDIRKAFNYNKYKRMQYAIKKIYEKDGELNFDSRSSSFERLNYKYYISMEHCYCNNKPFHSYEWMVSHPRGIFSSRDGIRYIMCELSGDDLTYYTRFKLSNYLANRLR